MILRRQPVYQKLAARANLTSSSACRNMEDLLKIHNSPDSDHRPTTHAHLAHCAAFGGLGDSSRNIATQVLQLLGRHAVFMQAFRGINHEVAVDAAHVFGQLPLARVGRRLFYLILSLPDLYHFAMLGGAQCHHSVRGFFCKGLHYS